MAFAPAADAVTSVYRFDCFELDPQRRRLLCDGGVLALGARAFDVLLALVERAGDLVTKDELLARAWPNLVVEAESTPATAAAVLQRQEAAELTARERALATWAAQVVADPNAVTAEDVDRLRHAGLTDEQIFDATVFIAFRLAFSTVNDALGARPDRELGAAAPAAVRDAVAYGRRVAEPLSQ